MQKRAVTINFPLEVFSIFKKSPVFTLPVPNVTYLRLNSKHEIRNSKQIQITKI